MELELELLVILLFVLYTALLFILAKLGQKTLKASAIVFGFSLLFFILLILNLENVYHKYIAYGIYSGFLFVYVYTFLDKHIKLSNKFKKFKIKNILEIKYKPFKLI